MRLGLLLFHRRKSISIALLFARFAFLSSFPKLAKQLSPHPKEKMVLPQLV